MAGREEVTIPALKGEVLDIGKPRKGKTLKLNERDDVLVRKSVLDEDVVWEAGSHLSLEKRAAILKEMFSELEAQGIPVVTQQFFVGLDEKQKKTLFALVEKISPLPISSTVSKKVTQRLFENLFNYYEEKAKSGAPFLWDISDPDQYVYGKKKGDSKAKFYLVDTDPYVNAGTNNLRDELNVLADNIQEFGLKFKNVTGTPYEPLLSRIQTLQRQLEK